LNKEDARGKVEKDEEVFWESFDEEKRSLNEELLREVWGSFVARSLKKFCLEIWKVEKTHFFLKLELARAFAVKNP
jgi:hypothetical protein